MRYRQLKQQNPEVWNPSIANEISRLAQGYKKKKGTNTITFIAKQDILDVVKVTYARIVPDYRPLKDEQYCTRLTVGGDRLPYHYETKTDTASLPTIKTHLDSTISTPNATYALISKTSVWLTTSYSTQKSCAYILKGMCGLKQAGRIAFDNLVKHMKKYGYHPCRITKELWTHISKSITFVLVVDDFGIKYEKEFNLNHLLNALKERYKISIDREAKNYVCMQLDWDYINRTVDISMPNYIKDLLTKIQHKNVKIEYAPHTYNVPAYSSKIQYADNVDTSPVLSDANKKHIQKIIGSLCYYGRAVDPTILVALNTLTSQQNAPTAATATAITKLLNYAANHQHATIRYHKSDMVFVLTVTRPTCSNQKQEAELQVTTFYHPKKNPKNNGLIHTVCTIIKNIMLSAPEAKIAAAFLTTKDVMPIRIALTEMGHEQPATPLHTGISTAHGFLNETIKQKRTKAINMRFWLLVDRVSQNHFSIHWSPGSTNLADYFSKHHSPVHHVEMRKTFLYTKNEKSPTYSDVL